VVTGPDSVPPAAIPAPATPWWVYLITASVGVVTFIFSWLGKLAITKGKLDAAQASAMDSVTAAVSQTYSDYVNALKKAGTFGPTEQALAKEKAITLAKDLAKGPGKDLLLSYGREHIGAWIEQIITKLKGGTKLELGIPAAPVVAPVPGPVTVTTTETKTTTPVAPTTPATP
jgi:hypothetical protein